MTELEKAQNIELIEEMKEFFKVSSLEDVAEKLGYKRTTAATWRSKGVTDNAVSRFKNHISGIGGFQTSMEISHIKPISRLDNFMDYGNNVISLSSEEHRMLNMFHTLDKEDQIKIYKEIKRLANEKLDLSHLDEA